MKGSTTTAKPKTTVGPRTKGGPRTSGRHVSLDKPSSSKGSDPRGNSVFVIQKTERGSTLKGSSSAIKSSSSKARSENGRLSSFESNVASSSRRHTSPRHNSGGIGIPGVQIQTNGTINGERVDFSQFGLLNIHDFIKDPEGLFRQIGR